MDYTLGGLSPHYQDILNLRSEGYTLEEIAEKLSVKESYVSNEIRKMKRRGMPIPKIKSGPRANEPLVLEDYILPTPKFTNVKCKYFGCKEKSCYTWGLVPLCTRHYGAIKDETDFYYAGAKKVKRQWDRLEYMKIANLIPWAVLKGRH